MKIVNPTPLNFGELPKDAYGFVGSTLETVRQILATGEELTPVCFITNNREVMPVGMIFRNQSEKEQAAQAVKKLIGELKAKSVFLILESWSTPPDKGQEFLDGQKAGKWRSVSEYPGKIEIVYLTYENCYGSWQAVLPIETKNGVKSIDLTKAQFNESTGQVSGIFANLINLKLLLH